MIATVTGSVILLQGLFLLVYRRPFRTFLLAFLPVAMGVLYGFGAYCAFLTTLSPIAAVIGAILAGMGIDYSIQYLANYEASLAEAMQPRHAAERTSLNVAPAIFAAWLTSIVGFLAIGASDVPALREFALLGTLGLSGAFLGSIWILPALLVISGINLPPSRLHAGPLLRRLALHRTRALTAMLTVLIASVAFIALGGRALLPLESDLSVMHPRPNPALEAQRRIAQKFQTSPDSLLVHLQAKTPDDLLTLTHRVSAALSSDRARKAGVTGTFGLASLLPDPTLADARRAATGPQVAQRVINDFNDVVHQTIFDPAAFKPYTEFLNHLLTRTQPPDVNSLLQYPALARTILPKNQPQPTESLMLVFLAHPLDERAARDRSIGTITNLLQPIGGGGATITGLSVLAHNTEQTIRRDLPKLIGIAVALVLIYLLVHFRNIRDALLAMIPTLVGFALLLTFMRLAGQSLNMINLAALPLLIGIDVDYGIFLVHLARTNRLPPATEAVILCAAATFLGFISLVTSSVPAVQSLGVAMAAGIAAAMIGTLFVLVPLLLRRDANAD
jgi:predicted RND superfamily exporter protein